MKKYIDIKKYSLKKIRAICAMNKFMFFLTVALLMFCSTSVKSQPEDNVEERTQQILVEAVDWLYDRFEGFDRECFLIGTFTEEHYQTFTANKSDAEINDRVKWLFEKDLKFVPDTMRCRRITAYGCNDAGPALFVTTLFKNDYPDVRALRVCSDCPFVRHYGDEIKTDDGNRDPVCTNKTDYDIELFSSSLAKTVAGYYNFDYDNVATVSSGGDIGYRGAVKKEKIATEAQKMSFLAGVFLRTGCYQSQDDSGRYSIHMHDSPGTLTVDILKEFGCDNVERIETKIVFNASDKIRDHISFAYDLFLKAGVLIVY
jgi:hypothetical protein